MKVHFLHLLFGSFVLVLAMITVKDFKKISFHPDQKVAAFVPDDFLNEAAVCANANKLSLSAIQLNKAMQAIRNFETGLTGENLRSMEKSIDELEKVKKSLLMRDADMSDLQAIFSTTLNTLAKTELELSETFIRSHNEVKARISIENARQHIKNSLSYLSDYSDSEKLVVEKHMLSELNQIVSNHPESSSDYSIRVHSLIDDVDLLLSSN